VKLGCPSLISWRFTISNYFYIFVKLWKLKCKVWKTWDKLGLWQFQVWEYQIQWPRYPRLRPLQLGRQPVFEVGLYHDEISLAVVWTKYRVERWGAPTVSGTGNCTLLPVRCAGVLPSPGGDAVGSQELKIRKSQTVSVGSQGLTMAGTVGPTTLPNFHYTK